MVFDDKTLVLAKRARRAKHRAHLKRKFARTQAERERMRAGGPTAASQG
jgi:hypothetical protein